MIYEQLFARAGTRRVVRAGVIGTGHFATAVVTQAQAMPRLSVRAVADVSVAAAQRAFALAGLPADAVRVCDSRATALRALENGLAVLVGLAQNRECGLASGNQQPPQAANRDLGPDALAWKKLPFSRAHLRQQANLAPGCAGQHQSGLVAPTRQLGRGGRGEDFKPSGLVVS